MSALGDMIVSPDEDLAAYWSAESGRREVYVRNFPEARQPETVLEDGN